MSASDIASPQLDRLCESCGYNLRGLEGNRCPECGTEFDPLRSPRAQIPWLQRDELGHFIAYIQTVVQVIVHPVSFAQRFQRPARIDMEDSQKFRTISIMIAVFGAMMIPIGGMMSDFVREGINLSESVQAIALLGCMGLPLYFFFWLATNFSTTSHGLAISERLSAILNYASALIVVISLLGTTSLLAIGFATTFANLDHLLALVVSVGCTIVILKWAIILVMVSAGAEVSRRELIGLAIRIPVAWFFSACAAVSLAIILGLAFALIGSIIVGLSSRL